MVLHKKDASTITWAIADVQKYYYGDVTTAINSHTTGEKFDVLVYPNPSDGSFSINYQVKQNGNINISILSIDGRVIEQLLYENREPGEYSLNWNANLKAGSYLVKVQNENNLIVKKIIILK